MAEYGVTATGFRIKGLKELDDSLKDQATIAFRTLLGEDQDWEVSWDNTSPVAVFYRCLEAELYRVWTTLEDVYYSANPITAQGDALDLLVSEHYVVRRAAAKARGIVTFVGSPGTTVKAGTVVSTRSGTQFVTVEEAVIPDGGKVDVWVEAKEPGVLGNVTSGAIQLVQEAGTTVDIDNSYELSSLTVDASANTQFELPADGSEDRYQLVLRQDIEHPRYISEIRFWVKNGTSEVNPITYRLRCKLIDDETGQVLGYSAEQEIVLDRDEEGEVIFDGLSIDIGYSVNRLRIVLINQPDSQYPIQVLANTTNPYPNGYWVQDGVTQAGVAALFTLKSLRPGGAWGGANAESDAELRRRYFETKAMGGASHLLAVKSRVWNVPGVKAVKVLQNREDVQVGGLPPHSVKVVVQGGDNLQVAAALLASVPAGIKLVGDYVVEVEDSYGESHPIRFSRPTVKNVYVSVKVKRGAGFTMDTITAIKDAVVQAIGGTDSSGQYHAAGIGTDVSYARVVTHVSEVEGVADIQELYIGLSDPPDQVGNIEIGDTEVAETSHDLITVSWE